MNENTDIYHRERNVTTLTTICITGERKYSRTNMRVDAGCAAVVGFDDDMMFC